MSIRVALADDHPLARRGLHQYLDAEDDVTVVVEAASGEELLELVESESVDVALVDVRMPSMSGVETVRQLTRSAPDVRVVMLSAFDDLDLVLAAVQAGARGYLLKSRDPGHILHAVRLAAEGDMVFDPDLAPAIAAGLAQGPADPGPVKLTAREQEILQMLPSGRTNREIAVALRRSPDTIKGHLERIFRKLGAQDRTAAVAEAFRRGLLH
jgi:DNA-binding NarL/FixJ family response regulator